MSTRTDRSNSTISIVIINKNEIGVEDTLEAIRDQKIALKYNTIVIDASLGRLDDIYNKFKNIRVIPFISKSNKPVTIPEQRNVGIKAAKSDIVVFIDAGCVPGKTWLSSLTYPILYEGEEIAAGITLSTGKKTFHDIGIEANSDKKYINEAPTINLAISKTIFEKIGYFNENLLYGSDMDLTWRIRAAGIKIRSVKSATITHDWGGIKQEIKRGYRYGQAKANLYYIHKHMRSKFISRELTLVLYLTYLLLLPLTFKFLWYPLLILIPAAKNMRPGYWQLPVINIATAWGFIRQVARIIFG